MRTESEMLSMILDLAGKDARVRAVLLAGARAAEDLAGDRLTGYEVAWAVTETESFFRNREWLAQFGPCWSSFCPQDDPDVPRVPGEPVCWQLRLADGCRLTLLLEDAAELARGWKREALLPEMSGNLARWLSGSGSVRVLLDKDGAFSSLPGKEARFTLERPLPEQFAHVCRGFWWQMSELGERLWRGDFLGAGDVLERRLRPALDRMLSWHAGLRLDFSAEAWRAAEPVAHWLSAEEWEAYSRSWALAALMDDRAFVLAEDAWEDVLELCTFFESQARYVASTLGFFYEQGAGGRCRGYLRHLLALPRQAKEFFSDGDIPSERDLRQMERENLEELLEREVDGEDGSDPYLDELLPEPEEERELLEIRRIAAIGCARLSEGQYATAKRDWACAWEMMKDLARRMARGNDRRPLLSELALDGLAEADPAREEAWVTETFRNGNWLDTWLTAWTERLAKEEAWEELLVLCRELLETFAGWELMAASWQGLAARCLFALGRDEEAYSCCRELLARHPAEYRIAGICCEKLAAAGRKQEAYALLARSLKGENCTMSDCGLFQLAARLAGELGFAEEERRYRVNLEKWKT